MRRLVDLPFLPSSFNKTRRPTKRPRMQPG
jgi:hypothetical protein